MSITYGRGTITIVVEKDGDERPFQLEQEAMIAYNNGTSCGLAYLTQTSGEEVSYSVTHIGSGTDLCPWWVAETEEEVQGWISALLKLADWTGKMPRAIVPMSKLLCYATAGVCSGLMDGQSKDG
jgi:hypothetical protein